MKMDSQGQGKIGNIEPVILNSIHNDGLSLEHKIKDVLKWKMEAYEQKQKLKDDRVIQLEVNINRLEKQLKDTVAAISDATQTEFNKIQTQIYTLNDKTGQHDHSLSMLSESLTQPVSESILQNMLPQVEEQIQSKLNKEKDQVNNFKSELEVKIEKLQFEIDQVRDFSQKETSRQSKDFNISLGKIEGELKIRNWEIGDRISPIGMTGSQLISDIIKDAKITADEKRTQLVAHDDNKILWCIGLKISREAIASPESENILRCSVTFSKEEQSGVQ